MKKSKKSHCKKSIFRYNKDQFIFINQKLSMQALIILITILSIVITLLVMLQSKGTGFSIVPGSNDFGKFERRGAEKTVHLITIALVVIFILACIAYYIAA